MQFKIISDISDFQHLSNLWNRLISNKHSVFQTFEFNFFSWKYLLINNPKNKLCIVVVTAEFDKQSIFPFYIDESKNIRFINDLHSDYCDFIGNSNFDISKVFSVIKNEHDIKSIRLLNLKSSSLTYKFLKINLDFKFFHIQKKTISSYLILEKKEFPDNSTLYKSKQKTEFKRIIKIHKSSRHIVMQFETNIFPINEIYYMRNRMIKLGIRKNNFLNESQINIIRELYNSKKLIISLVSHNNKAQAISFILKNNHKYLFWIDMFDNIKLINLFNYIMLIKKVSDKNSVKIDFGRGGYIYKLYNFKPKIEYLSDIYLFYNMYDFYIYRFKYFIINSLKYIYKKIIQ